MFGEFVYHISHQMLKSQGEPVSPRVVASRIAEQVNVMPAFVDKVCVCVCVCVRARVHACVCKGEWGGPHCGLKITKCTLVYATSRKITTSFGTTLVWVCASVGVDVWVLVHVSGLPSYLHGFSVYLHFLLHWAFFDRAPF